MKVISIQEAKTHLSRYVEEVAAGAEVIILSVAVGGTTFPFA